MTEHISVENLFLMATDPTEIEIFSPPIYRHLSICAECRRELAEVTENVRHQAS